MQKKIGIIAGLGKLPLESAKIFKEKGYKVCIFAVLNDVEEALEQFSDFFYRLDVSKMADFFRALQSQDIYEVVMLGKVTKELLFHRQKEVQLDPFLKEMLFNLPNMHDDTIMLAIIALFEKYGIKVLEQTKAIEFLLPKASVLTECKPSLEEKEDLDYAFEMAKRLGELDIGQTVVVKNKAVLAVEAIEGTDECIKRGGNLAGEQGGAVVGKTAKPKQDLRFDLPTIGKETIQTMIASKIKALVIEAGKTFLVEKEDVLRLANEHKMVIEVR